MKNNHYNRPLIPLVVSLAAGIAAGETLPGFSVVAGSTALFVSAIVLTAVMTKRRLTYSPVLLLMLVGYLLIQPCVDGLFTDGHILSYTGTTKYRITGIVDSRPVEKKRKQVFILRPETLAGEDGICRAVSGNIRVSIYGGRFLVEEGDRVVFTSRIRRFRNFNNPGSFDYEQFMAFKNVWGSAYASEKNIAIMKTGMASPVKTAQDSVIKLIDSAVHDTGAKGVLKALIVGDKQWILPELRDEFNRTGTGHLLAISGLHIGIVAAFSFGCFCYLLSFSQTLLWNGTLLKYGGLLALVPVMAYGFIAGLSPSTQRAVIMVAVMLLGYSFRAEYDIINSIALAAMVILIISPASLFSISFQLSFMAVFSIAVGLAMMKKKAVSEESLENRHRFLQKVKTKLFSYFLVSFFAFAGTLPIVSCYFNQVSLIGLAANFILIPIVGFLVVPAGLMAAFLNPFSSALGGALIKLSGLVLEKALEMIHFFSEFPYAAVKTVTPSMVQMICYYIFFFLSVHFFTSDKESKQTVQRMRMVFCVLVLVLVADISFQAYKRFFHNSFIVTALDVGQGSSTLLEFPDGTCMLIDGGGFNDNSAFDVGQKIVAPFLWGKNIKTVDTVVLTHPESDHLNGLLYILRHFNVKEVWSNGQKRFIKGYKEFETIIKEENIRHEAFAVMPRTSVIQGVTIELLYPPDDAAGKPIVEKPGITNNNSLVMRAAYKGISFLFPGDIMKKAETELVKKSGGRLKSTVLFVPHHGSKTSTTAAFLRRVSPGHAVISVGWKNRFRMPHKSVLKRLNDAGVHIYRTDSNGATVMTVTEDSFRIVPEI